MAKKLMLGAVLGGLILFVWGAVSHMLLPVERIMYQSFANPDAVLQAITANATKPGVYLLPDLPPDTPAEKRAELEQQLMEKAIQGPFVFAAVRLGPGPFGTALGIQLVIEALGAMLATWLLMQSKIATYGGRVMFVMVVGAIICVAGALPEWNWYGFGAAYTLTESINLLVGWTLLGLVLAKLVPAQQT